MTWNPVKTTIELKVDLSKIEERIMADLAAGDHDSWVDVVMKLPRHHPLRFGLLYGMGPRKLADYVARLIQPTHAEKEVALEAEVQCFENWQSSETVDAHRQLRAENAAIAYAAMEEGMPEAHPRPQSPTAGRESPTGRWAATAPEPQYWPIRRSHRWTRPLWQGPALNYLVQSSGAADEDNTVYFDLETLPGPTVGMTTNASVGAEWAKPLTMPDVRDAVKLVDALTKDYPEEGILRD